nr:diguanylate cyclase [Butyrivibrio sp.]
YEGRSIWLPLSNGMYLNITVPTNETQGEWQRLILNILIVAILAMILSSIFLMFFLKVITKPLEQLTEAAEQVDKGNFDINLTYDTDDEIGRLTKSFKILTGNMKAHINALNEQVFIDSLTHVRNKGAFSIAAEELQEQINNGSIDPNFAIGAFDCDGLKKINDEYGHDKGDIYLKKACRTLSDVLKRSPVYRVGGDEFFIILKNEDFRNLDFLLDRFDKVVDEINATADMLMYENKRERKMCRET